MAVASWGRCARPAGKPALSCPRPQRAARRARQASPPRAGRAAGARRTTTDDGGWRRSASGEGGGGGGRPSYYDDAGEEAGALLYERDELVERCGPPGRASGRVLSHPGCAASSPAAVPAYCGESYARCAGRP